jgi:hypothetical protein
MAVNLAAKAEISMRDMDPNKSIEDNAKETIIIVGFDMEM